MKFDKAETVVNGVAFKVLWLSRPLVQFVFSGYVGALNVVIVWPALGWRRQRAAQPVIKVVNETPGKADRITD